MRTILFRGYNKTIKKWIFGGYYFYETPKIITPDSWSGAIHVEPETVGQYIGLTDKKKNKIFEHDIVKIENFNKPLKISFIEGAFCLANLDNGEFAADIHYIHHGGVEQAEIIGNIFNF